MIRKLMLLIILVPLTGCIGPTYQEARVICHDRAKPDKQAGLYSNLTTAWMQCMMDNGHQDLFKRDPYWSRERCGVSGFYCAPPHGRK